MPILELPMYFLIVLGNVFYSISYYSHLWTRFNPKLTARKRLMPHHYLSNRAKHI